MVEQCVPYARRRYLELYNLNADSDASNPIFKSIDSVIRGWGSGVFDKAKADNWWVFDYPVNLCIITFPGPTQYGHVGVIESGFEWTYLQGVPAPRLSGAGVDRATMSHSNWPMGYGPKNSTIRPTLGSDGAATWKKVTIDGGATSYDVSGYVAIGPG